MNVFNKLTPTEIWKYFEEICTVPRPSKNEGKMIQFLLDFGQKQGFETKHDEKGNVLISKPASKGKENLKPVILQSHMDMVCEKNSDSLHDFENDPITPFIDGEWVKAVGTTLGADDGIGMAAQMAILTSKTIVHGPLECLFTVDEETGLSGAAALKPNFMKGKILINLDSEDEGELFIGCAGGKDTVANLSYFGKKTPKNSIALSFSVTGLKGGHSGDDINKGLGNSIKILNRFLWDCTQKHKIRLVEFHGGNLRNAIPREAFATITVEEKLAPVLLEQFQNYIKTIQFELKETEPDLALNCKEVELPKFVLKRSSQNQLLNSLYACPHGVIAMSAKMPGLVETSTNLASVKFKTDKTIEITTSQRSDIESAKDSIASMVESVFLLADATVSHSEGYPGWAPNPDSEILKITQNAYKQLFNVEPVVRSIHAGLECGLFFEKFPYMDMISFGPTLRGVHSPDERLQIPSVQKFWDLLLLVLTNIPVA
jgi:dipeptidase D